MTSETIHERWCTALVFGSVSTLTLFIQNNPCVCVTFTSQLKVVRLCVLSHLLVSHFRHTQSIIKFMILVFLYQSYLCVAATPPSPSSAGRFPPGAPGFYSPRPGVCWWTRERTHSVERLRAEEAQEVSDVRTILWTCWWL